MNCEHQSAFGPDGPDMLDGVCIVCWKERAEIMTKQRDQVLHLLAGGTLTEKDVDESGLGRGVLSEQRHHEAMRCKAEACAAEMREALSRCPHDHETELAKMPGLLVPRKNCCPRCLADKSIYGVGWLSPEKKKVLVEALLLYHEAWNGAEGDWRTPMRAASKNATEVLAKIRGETAVGEKP